MLEKLIFKNVFDDTFKRKIENNHEACLRRRSERNKCERCFEVCSEDAIELTRGGVKIDPILCTGCNECVSSCYTRALQSEKRPYLKSVNLFLDSNVSNWGCIKTKDTCDVNFGCLRTIDEKFLISLAYSDIEQEIYMDFSKCETCQYKNIGKDKKELLEYITIHSGCKNFKFINGHKDKKQEIEGYSRREFFKSIIDSTKDYSKETIRETYKSIGLDFENKEDVDNLISILIKKGNSYEKPNVWIREYIFDISCNENCTMCHECVTYCPTGALKIENSVDSQKLVVDMAKCTFCNRCIEKCRFQALSKETYKGKEKKVIYKKTKERCGSCRVLSAELNSDGICPTCEKRRNNRKKL